MGPTSLTGDAKEEGKTQTRRRPCGALQEAHTGHPSPWDEAPGRWALVAGFENQQG